MFIENAGLTFVVKKNVMFLYKNQIFIEKHGFNVYYIHKTQKNNA